jgi:drug/metabolite transporter (DMT)-like permease
MTPNPDRRMFALGLRLVAISCLSTMVVIIKLAGESGIRLPEIMFWRQALAVLVVLSWVIVGPGLASLKTQRLGSHAKRSALGLTSMMFNFTTVIMLPLAEATVLGFTVPIFATILSVVVLKERTGWHRWGAVIAGFIGVLIMVQPGSGHFPPLGAVTGLITAVSIAFISLQIRDLGRTEAATTTAFWFSLLSVPPLALLMPFYASPHGGHQWLLLGGIGTLGALGQIALTASLRFAPVSVVVGMDYISLLWSTLFGWLIWQQLPGSATWIGAPIIIASGLYIAWREHRLAVERARDVIG